MVSTKPKFDRGRVAEIPAGSSWDHEFTLFEPEAPSDAADYSAVMAVADVARFRMWDADGTTALISATDQAASAGGTAVNIETRGTADTTPARITVKLSATDTDQSVGEYKFLVDIQDASDTSRWHPACKGTIKITGAPS